MKAQATSNSRGNTLFLAQFSILLAIEAITCFTPLGSLPVGPLVATLSMIPVILTAILLGTGAGAAMGGFFGLFSFIVWTFMPPSPMAFVFTPFYSLGEFQGNGWSLVICFVPRILTGVVAGLTFRGMRRAFPDTKHPLVYSVAGIAGSLANTLLVMGGIYVFFGRDYASLLETPFSALLGLIGLTIATNGMFEATVSGVAAYFVCRPVQKYLLRGR